MSKELTYGPWLKVIGWLGLVCYGGLAVACYLTAPAKDKWATLIFIGFTLLSVYLIAQANRERIEYDEAGVRAFYTFHAPRDYRWPDFTKVEFSQGLQCLTLHTRQGRKLRISIHLRGLQSFAEMLKSIRPDLAPPEQEKA